MRIMRRDGEMGSMAGLGDLETKLLTAAEERDLLLTLGDCKAKLGKALASVRSAQDVPDGADAPRAFTQYVADFYARNGGGASEARLGAVFRLYSEARGKLALANVRLVAHVAKRFRDRGIAHADLLQEGFCGLLEAIDRFDLTHETKLATYATWWIRQAMQQAVAAGAYPVRLTPRHLRQLAQSQEEVGRDDPAGAGGTETIRRIHDATRPAVSLDAKFDGETQFSLLEMISDPEADLTIDVDMEEMIAQLIGSLQPREQQVLTLRFGLGGKSRHSLSMVGQVLQVSKERIRQIQDRALEKLRNLVIENDMAESLSPN
jgi:RNA polymerase primary sigma factor